MKAAHRFSLLFALAILAIAAFDPPVDLLIVLALTALLGLREAIGRDLAAHERNRIDLLAGIGLLAFLVIVVSRVVQIVTRV